MADAKKCDACDNFFTPGRDYDAPDVGIMKKEYGTVYKRMDICDDCMEKIEGILFLSHPKKPDMKR
jgi:hypothetical protein